MSIMVRLVMENLPENLPDEDLMEKLEKQRGRGRDDDPVRAIWNSILAGVVFQHTSVESLRRELERNGSGGSPFLARLEPLFKEIDGREGGGG